MLLARRGDWEELLVAYTMKIGLTGMPQVYNLNFPVGERMPNVRDDVLLVQTLIKHAHYVRFTPAMGPVESSSSIAVDGYFGPQTKRMIAAFEADMKSFGKLLVADGIVEPAPSDGFTHSGVLYKIIHLNRAMKDREGGLEFLPFSSDTHPILRASLIKGAVEPPHRQLGL